MYTCVEHGLNPENVQDVTTFTEAADMVAEHMGFTFARPWPDRVSSPGVVFKPIEGNPLAVETGIGYGQAARGEVIEKLISVLAKKHGPQAVPMSIPESDPSEMIA